jgi:predicted Zn-dependent protease with MMP-like domain
MKAKLNPVSHNVFKQLRYIIFMERVFLSQERERKMEIRNETQWCMKDLRKLFAEVCKQMGETTKRIIEVRTSKKRYGMSYYHGLGSCSRNWVELRIPDTHCIVSSDGRSNVLALEHPDSVKIAQVLMHEIGHNQGLHHKEMENCWNINCDWANQFVINKKPKKLKVVRNLLAERSAFTAKKVKEYQSKCKRMQNLLRKWQRKQKYYAKKTKN